MEIFFVDPDDIPLSPDEVRIRQLTAHPHPDGQRVRVYFEITPFQQRPDAELHITNSNGEQVASVSVIETIDPKMEITMHLPASIEAGQFTLHGVVFYRQAELEGDAETQESPEGNSPRQIVDRSETVFEVA
jgi:hypothetical protein